MEEIAVKYSGVEIVYAEGLNKWRVNDEKHGITLSSASLELAKKSVDAAFRKAKQVKYKPFEAWYSQGYGLDRLVKVMVTSFVTSNTDYDSGDAWITLPKHEAFSSHKKGRAKVSVSELYKVTKANDNRVLKMQDISIRIDKLSEEKTALRAKLIPITIPISEPSEDS